MCSGKQAFSSTERRWWDRWLSRPFVALIIAYQRLLSPFLGNACRFYPSCSVYARQALDHRPVLVAAWLIVKRLAKCHPFHPGGYDPLDEDDDSAPASGDGPAGTPGGENLG